MIQNDWKEIRWNEADKLFNELLKAISSQEEQEYLFFTVQIVSDRLARTRLSLNY